MSDRDGQMKDAKKVHDLDPGLAPMPFSALFRNALGLVWGFTTPFIVFSQIVFPIIFAIYPTKLAPRFCEWLISYWILALRNIYALELDVHGLDNIKPNQSYVICANHRSWLDAMMLITALKRVLPFAFVIKKELSYIPLAGWYMILAGYVPVDRGQSRRKAGKGKQKLTKAAQMMKAGTNVLVFPEGTRAPTHRFVKCKKGAAILAHDAGAELLPVIISGTARLMPKKTPFIRPGRVRLEVLPPIRPQEGEDVAATTRRVQEALVENYRLDPDAPKAKAVPGLVEQLTP